MFGPVPRTVVRRVLCAALGSILLGAALAGCADRTGAADGRLRLGMVTDVGGLGDRSFNDSAYAGLLRARDELGAHITVVQSRSAADYQPNLIVLSNKGYDMIFAIGFLMAKDLTDVAGRFPERHYGVIDAVVDDPNVTSVTFQEEQGSFLAGAAAAMVSKTHQIAFLGGVDIPLLRKFEAGFTAGAREIDPAIRVEVKYVGSFDDVAAGKELAGVLFDQGADIIFAAAGKGGVGALDQVRARSGDYVIGVDSDQDALVPGKILTSMVKHVDRGVFLLAKRAAAHTLKGGHIVLGLKEGGVGLTDFTYTRGVMTPARRGKLGVLEKMLEAGTIVAPSTREELASFKPVPLP
jgi:basic membrane protein A